MSDTPESALPLPGRPGGPDVRERLRGMAAATAAVVLGALATAAVTTVSGALPRPAQAQVQARPAVRPQVPAQAGPSVAVVGRVLGVAGTAPGSTAPAMTATDRRAAAAARLAAARTRQARVLDRLLDEGARGRGQLVGALRSLERCSGSRQAAVRGLQLAHATRITLLRRLGEADVRALPQGARLRAMLTATWTASREANARYLAWAAMAGPARRCLDDDSSRTAGQAAERRATAAGRAFVAVWNSRVARPGKLRARSAGEL